jgi:signal-transduction protein with cAMP-binding, CBS, and nucleotidyltransferase domain
MRELPASTVIVTSPEGRPLGILTEQDVTRRIAFSIPATTPIVEIMTSPLHTIRDDDYLFHGIAIMRRMGLRHLPVVNSNGHIVGLMSHDALAEAISRMVDLIERLTHEETREGLSHVKDAEVEVVDALLQDGIPILEIQTLLTHINNDIYSRVATLVLKELAEEGWGEPPVQFDLIVMGSSGRGETFLYPDQDNGLILADYPDAQHGMVDAFFMELSVRMCDMLDSVGFPRCRGYVMARNPLWRKTLTQWFMQIDYWLNRPKQTTLRFADIFFDFQHVFGSRNLADSLRNHVINSVRHNHAFLKEMQRVQDDHGVALSILGKLYPVQEGLHKGKLDLKYHGLLPLVESIRLFALREGMEETSTSERIAALSGGGVLGHNEEDNMIAALQHLTALILRQQIRDFKDGMEVGPYVSPNVLSERERTILVDSLRAINALRKRLRTEFTAEVF